MKPLIYIVDFSPILRLCDERRITPLKNNELEKLRSQFPAGTRVELVEMDDPQVPLPGTRGSVQGVDDAGQLLMRWDTGSGLNVIWGEDKIRKVCPKCGKGYNGYPAMSRADGKEICPECGVREALEAFATSQKLSDL